MFTGCTLSRKLLYTIGGSLLGGGLGYYALDEDSKDATIGTLGGGILGALVESNLSRARDVSFKKGYNKGYQTQQLDVVNKNWINNTGANSQKDYIPLKIRKCVKVPAKEVNGIVYEEHEECFDVYK